MFIKIYAILITLIFLFSTPLYAEKKEWMLEKKITDQIPGENIASIINVFNQIINYPYPKSWPLNPVYRNETKTHFISERIPQGQTLEHWKDMFTIQGFKNYAKVPGMTVEKFLNLLKKQFHSIAPDQLYYKKIFQGDINGTPGIIALAGIKKLPKNITYGLPEGVGEIGLYLVLKGKQDLYMIHRSWKSTPYTNDKLPMSSDELNKWTNLLKQVTLINKKI